MQIKMHDELEYGGKKFYVVGFELKENMGGFALYITSLDKDSADKLQQQGYQMQNIHEGTMTTVQKFLEKLRDGGIDIGGMGG